MFAIFDPIRGISMPAVTVRLLLAVICGGLIGMEREYKRRPAGFRTHILICLGASMTMLTSQYLCLVLDYPTDPSRLGAQVIAGIGFIGAGTIIVTRHQRVKGLTTAAGLWVAAIIGLAIGSGFYEGGIFTTILILIAELFFSRVEYRILSFSPEINLYMEYRDRRCLENVLNLYKRRNVKVLNLEITRDSSNEMYNACAIFSLRLNRKCTAEQLIAEIQSLDNISSVEEL